MTLTNFSSDISIIWFWAGLFVLLGLGNAYRRVKRADRKAVRLRGDLEFALHGRRSEMQNMFLRDKELVSIVRSAEEAITSAEVFACEADLDLWIYRRQERESGDNKASNSDIARFLENVTANLRPFRDRYNEAASVAASQRRSFPEAIIARSYVESDLPLFPDLELI